MLDVQFALVAMVFLVGIRHGFEPDHLAVIDSMTRCTRYNHTLAKYVGLLFSFGHGTIIIFLTILISTQSVKWSVPSWFNGLGIWIAIFFLFFLGIYNIYISLRSDLKQGQTYFTPKLFFLNKFIKLNNFSTPILAPIIVGMLFSLSFDTLSQTMAFSITGYELVGWYFPICLGIIFTCGMMLADGLNGYLVARIINQSDKKSLLLSRILGLLIGGFSIAIGVYYFYGLLSPIE